MSVVHLASKRENRFTILSLLTVMANAFRCPKPLCMLVGQKHKTQRNH